MIFLTVFEEILLSDEDADDPFSPASFRSAVTGGGCPPSDIERSWPPLPGDPPTTAPPIPSNASAESDACLRCSDEDPSALAGSVVFC